MPLRAIREQIASAVDLIVHTARLKDGSRKITTITEVYGIEDDEILTQDIFVFEQTGHARRQDRGRAHADRAPADVHGPVRAQRHRAAAGRVRDPGEKDAKPISTRALKARWGGSAAAEAQDASAATVGRGRVVKAGGMVYIVVDRPDRPGDRRRS